MIKLDILSDPICPWCYIGKTQLERALAQVDASPFTIEWHPFQLNPDMPPQGMDRRIYLEQKFGGKQPAAAAYAKIIQYAEDIDLKIDVAAISRTPNTVDAHRLIYWAGQEGRQSEVIDLLFQAFLCDGKDISDINVLKDIAQTAGLQVDAIHRLLTGDADKNEIRARDAHSRKMGVTAVPTFIVGNRHVVEGAQPPELWINVIEDIKTQNTAPLH